MDVYDGHEFDATLIVGTEGCNAASVEIGNGSCLWIFMLVAC